MKTCASFESIRECFKPTYGEIKGRGVVPHPRYFRAIKIYLFNGYIKSLGNISLPTGIRKAAIIGLLRLVAEGKR